MKKIFSQLAGAAAVVAAVSAGLAYAQVSPSASAPANTQPADQRMNTGSAATTTATTGTVSPSRSEDVKSNSTDSRYGAGANNGSIYNPAIRSTGTSPGNVSSADDTVVRTTTTTTPAAAMTPPAAMPMQSSTTSENSPAYVAPAPAAATGTTDGSWNADGTRAARADRN